MTEHTSPAGTGDVATAELIHRLTEQTSRLVRDELKLAQAEMTRKGTRLARGASLVGGGGVAALYGVACLLAAAVAGLATVLAVWLAALVVGAVLLMVAGVVALSGKRQVSRGTPLVPQEALDSVKLDAETISGRARR
jgi:hypothetical protein